MFVNCSGVPSQPVFAVKLGTRLPMFMKTFLSILVALGLCCLPERTLAQLAANFTATPLTGCAPLIVNFTNTSTGSPTSYSWDLGNGVTSVAVNPSTSYTLPGTYTVTLTVSNAGGSNTKTVVNYITVLPLPNPNFNFSPTNGCPPALGQLYQHLYFCESRSDDLYLELR